MGKEYIKSIMQIVTVHSSSLYTHTDSQMNYLFSKDICTSDFWKCFKIYRECFQIKQYAFWHEV